MFVFSCDLGYSHQLILYLIPYFKLYSTNNVIYSSVSNILLYLLGNNQINTITCLLFRATYGTDKLQS